MKQTVSLFCIAVSATFSLLAMEEEKSAKEGVAHLLARSKNKTLAVARVEEDEKGKLFSLYQLRDTGTRVESSYLYKDLDTIPIGKSFALHTTRGIFMTTEGFSIFDTNGNIKTLSSAKNLYNLIFSDRGAIFSLLTQLYLDMPDDTKVLISSSHGVSVFDIVKDEQIAFLTPCTKAPRIIASTVLQENTGKKVSQIPYDLAIYAGASKEIIGFCNPINKKNPHSIMTTSKKGIPSEKINAYIDYAKAHKTEKLIVFGNGEILCIDRQFTRITIQIRDITGNKKFAGTYLDIIDKRGEIALLLNKIPEETFTDTSYIAIISSGGYLLRLFEIPGSFMGITRINVTENDKEVMVWAEKKYGTAQLTGSNTAQYTSKENQYL